MTTTAKTPVFVSASGTIDTTGPYGILDSAPSNERLVNKGVVKSTAATGIGFETTGNGKVANDGLISGGAEGVDIAGSGTVLNLGTITATGTAGIAALLQNGGTVVNGTKGKHTATISGAADGVKMVNNPGTVDNFGTIIGTSNDGVEIDDANGGYTDTVVNGAAGALKSYLIEGSVNGVSIGTGSVTNWGTLVGTGNAGVLIGSGGIVNNGDAGDLGRLIQGALYGVAIGSGTVVNFGSIASTGIAGTGAQLYNGGTVVNGSAAITGLSITGAVDGVFMHNNPGTVNNYGAITGTSNDGVEIDDANGGYTDTLVNGVAGALKSYLIEGGVNGVSIGTGSVTNWGMLIGISAAGVVIGSGGTVNNGDASDLGRLIQGALFGIAIGSGTVVNFGSIGSTGTAGIGAQLYNGGTVVNGSATITGLSITGAVDGVFMHNNPGTVDNYGTITGTSSDGIEIDDANGGYTDTVVNGAAGALKSYLIEGGVNGVSIGTGSVANWGTLIGVSTAGVVIGSNGNVANGDASDLGRLIRGVIFGVLAGGGGTVTNFGSIAATGTTGIGVKLTNGGTVVNGSASVTGLSITGAGSDGVLMINNPGTVENFGTIIGTSNDGVEIDDANGGYTDTVVNGGTGELKSYLIKGAINGVYIGTGSVTNWGTLIGAADAGVAINGGGSVANGDASDLGRLIQGALFGVAIGSGTVVNFGSIGSTGTAGIGAQLYNGGTVVNGSATITGLSITGAGSDGVLMVNNPGTVDNFGTITGASKDGVEIDDANGGYTDTVVNGGTGELKSYLVAGGVNGVSIGTGSVTNWGTLVGTGNAGVLVGSGAIVNNGDASDLGRLIQGALYGVAIGSGTVVNFGSIGSTGAAGIGAQLYNGGTVVNGAATITGSSITGEVDGVFMHNNPGTVDNYGSIIGTSNDGVEIDNANGGYTDTVVNGAGALIKGVTGIALSGPSTVTTAGTIVGIGGTAIQFGNSNDTLTLQAGAVFVGAVNGGAGSNTIELAAGTGTTGNLGSQFVNFGQLAVDAGATWTLTASDSIAAVVDSGTLSVGASASLDITGSVSASSTGIFSLQAGATLELAADTSTQNSFVFLASADLTIDHAAQFGLQAGTASYAGPSIDDFIAGDSIDLKDIAAAVTLDYSSSTGLLQISSGGTGVATLFFQDTTLGSGSFHVGDDGSGHALITHS